MGAEANGKPWSIDYIKIICSFIDTSMIEDELGESMNDENG